uniref:Uncharacterized protein n=1 Tax=Anguilla anguilla TaxID=7936 RepID=A0A0E9UYM0_ANGAN
MSKAFSQLSQELSVGQAKISSSWKIKK